MDKEYWNDYYKKDIAPKNPSFFAKEILNKLTSNKSLLEIGCGNGRDSIFFGKNDLKVTSIDQAKVIIEKLKSENHKNIEFINDNFINSTIYNTHKFDYVYSRFTLHSIRDEEQDELLNNIYKVLNYDGILFIEARSINDNIYGLGENVGKNAYIYNNHYRRFLDINELTLQLENKGFEILFAKESNNWAVYKDEDPIVIRLYAKK